MTYKKIVVINLNRTILDFISCPLDNSKLEFVWPNLKCGMKKCLFTFFLFFIFLNTIFRSKLSIFMQSHFYSILNSSCITLLFMPMITRLQFSDK